MSTAQSRSVLRAPMQWHRAERNGGVCVRMTKVLIGVDPHKATVAVAAVDEVGELIECASFLQNRTGLRALERWAKRFPERRWAVENAGGLGVGTWPRG